MLSEELRRTILQVVANQIRMNDPPATKATYERLLRAGCDSDAAKNKIAEALFAETDKMLADGRPFDERSFAARLAKIG